MDDLVIYACLKVASPFSEEISINLKDNTSPITALEKSNSDLVYVLMPMRV